MDRTTTQQRRIELALAQAKRVQRESRILVKQLAQLRDSDPTAPEAQGEYEHIEGSDSND